MNFGVMWLAHCRTCLKGKSKQVVVLSVTDVEAQAIEWNLGDRTLHSECVICGTRNPGAMRHQDEFFLAMMSGCEDDRDDYAQ